MATTKKSPSKTLKSKKKIKVQAKPAKKLVSKKSVKKAVKKSKPALKSAKKPPAKKVAAPSNPAKLKPAVATAPVKAVPKKSPGRVASPRSRGLRGADSGGQSGDLQGLSNRERADSESVDELIEEGNSFEAGVVSGVEEADDHEGSEVHTRQFPEDDVPGEYLDED